MAQRVLITGGHGFVGTHVSRLLVMRGFDVTATVRALQHERDIGGVSYLALELETEAAAWIEALRPVNCVIHLAAHVHKMHSAGTDTEAFRRTNVVGTQLLAERAIAAGVRRFIYLSSVKVHGEGGDHEIVYHVDDPPSPQDDYARSKWEAEQLLWEICSRSDMRLAVIRPPLVYGPGVRANFRRLLQIANLGLPLPLGSLQNRRSLLGVWNLADFIALCIEADRACGRTWLVADGEDLSTPQLITSLAHHLNRPARLFRFPPRWLRMVGQLLARGAEIDRLCYSLRVDISRTREMLGWTPPMPVDAGLSLTAAAYLAERT